jgi:pimeloyl-ACP methyl ester carboxylesterase
MPYADVDGYRLHYRESGSGEPVLLLHGWPTSSFLWRNIMGPIADAGRRAIALDLVGFGASDKPVDASYSFRFHDRILTGFLDALGIARTSLAVHDLGGPLGLYWAMRHEDRLHELALLNTLIYPEMSWAVMAFVAACRLPGLRTLMASPWGLEQAMRIGVVDRSRLTEEVIEAVQAPFETRAARRALLKAGYGLHPDGLREIAAWLRTVKKPVRIVYGERDRILPDVAETMRRVKLDVPHAEITVLPDCGHFLQEDRPAEVASILAKFFGETRVAPHAS